MTTVPIVFFIVGIVALLSAILLLFLPELFLKMSDFSNRIFLTDENAIKYRYGFGVILLLVSIFMFFSFYHLLKIYY
jgi:hypothetical protein